jgi:hypothetical protein
MINKELYYQERHSEVYEDLDDESNALHITVGQNVGRYVICSDIGILINNTGKPQFSAKCTF